MSFQEYLNEQELNEGLRHNLSDESFIDFVQDKEINIDDAISALEELQQDLLDWKENGWTQVTAHHPKEMIPLKE